MPLNPYRLPARSPVEIEREAIAATLRAQARRAAASVGEGEASRALEVAADRVERGAYPRAIAVRRRWGEVRRQLGAGLAVVAGSLGAVALATARTAGDWLLAAVAWVVAGAGVAVFRRK